MTKFIWTVRIEVSPTWVADGFNIDEDEMLDMLQHRIRQASIAEFNVEILKAPDPQAILKIQGY